MTRKLLSILLLFIVGHSSRAQAPVADFGSSVVSGCAPLTVAFRDQSSGSPTFWNWDFGGGNLSNLQNPTMTFSTPGVYSVTLVVRNANGTNGITKTNYITVNPSPQAGFVSDLRIGCMPSTIQFTDLSNPVAGNLVGWEWDFGDGTTSTQQNPSHQYTATGFYTVALKVTSSTGCQGATSAGRYIRIVAGVIPDFSFNTPATCRPPFAVNFSNLTSGPGTINYQWNFGNGTNSAQETPTANYAATGTYTVTLNATSEYGCIGSIQKQVDISGTGTSFTGPDTICLNSTASFQNASTTTPLSTLWDFSNGTQSTDLNGSSTYNTAGTFDVKVKNTYDNCVDSFSKPLVVIDKPVVNFTAPTTTACKGPLTVNFQDASPGAVSWQWDFGDGGTSTQQNPSYVYANEGDYDVTLTITTRQGCTNTLTKPAFVKIHKPTITFANAPNGGCAGIFTFSPSVRVVTFDPVTLYSWDYGDGFTATSNTFTGPPHIYAAAGNYTIRVTITTAGGCTESITLVDGIRIGTPPASNFTMSATESCASNAISFTFVPSGPVPVDEWLWEFGDDSTSEDQNPTHIYADSGYYNVRVKAFNNKCSTDAPIQVVHIKAPIAHFSNTVTCPLTVNFADESKVNTALYGPVTYLWEFGDGATSTTIGNVSHNYAGVGTYTVKLTVSSTNPGECSHTYEKQIELLQVMPDIKIGEPSVCKNEAVGLTALNIVPENITKYEWSIDGGAYTEGKETRDVIFPNAGVYSVALQVTDINGCISNKEYIDTITVTGPVANFAPVLRGGCASTNVTFTDNSTGVGINSWTFDFGDGNSQTFTGAPFAHNYADTGRYVVKMTVTDVNGCPDTYTSIDTIFITKPMAGFTADYTTICPKTDLPFKDTSAGIGLSWYWDFGDGITSTDQSPVHQYTANTGSFPVKLVVTDAVGCKDSVTKTSYVTVKKPVPAFSIKDTSSICPLLETKFTFQGADYESFYWDFGDGDVSTLPNPNHFYNTYGSYEAKLYVIGYGGCIDSVSDTVNVYNPFTSSDMTYSPLTNCNSLTVDFSLTTPPGTRFDFNFGDGGVDNSQSKVFQHFYKQPGFYAPSMLLQDSVGCQVTVGGPNTIRVIGAMPFFGVDKKAFCDMGTVNFTNFTIGNDPVISRTWDFDDGSPTTSDTDPTHTFTQPGSYVVKHSVTTQAGCNNSITDTIRVYATPQPSIASDTVVCINDVLPLQGTLAVPDTAITWKWNLGSNGQSTDQNASVKYPQAGSYTVSLEATNKLGCKNQTSKSILVPPTPAVTVNGGITIPLGTGVTLPVTYSPNVVSYTWTPPGGLSCTDCPTPYADPRFTTQYTVKAEDIYGCSIRQGVTVTVVCNNKNYFVPNTFSPNGDGRNDVFMPRGSSIDRVSRMQVFNRWGEVVFEKRNFMVNDASAGWNGTYKGKPANADVYIYVIEFVCENAAIIPYRGNVTLLR